MNRIRGIDSIRFICAFCVVIGHLGIPPLFGTAHHGLSNALRGALRGVVNEQAAVIVFFLISGFFIHYPYRQGKAIHLPSFYTRRLIRIILPLLLCIPFGELVGVHYSVLRSGIFWSLIAEIVYYLIYPVLLLLHKRFGWHKVIIAAYVLAFSICLTHPISKDFQFFGDKLTWAIGLPCWLLGCLLAEKSDALPLTTPKNIWWWRAFVIGAACVTTVLRWHTPGISIGFPWSLNIFAIAAYFWLAQEIVHFRDHQPKRVLEWAGTWSYSLYLTHMPAALAAKMLFPGIAANPNLTQWLNISVALLCAYVFYLIIERPTHLLAVRLGNLSKGTPAAAA